MSTQSGTANPDYVRNIIATYYAASDAQCTAGREWYPRARAIVDTIVGYSGVARRGTLAVVVEMLTRQLSLFG